MSFVASMVGMVAIMAQPDAVDLTLLLPEAAVIETRLESSERVDGGDWTTSREAYRVEVRREGEAGYRTVWSKLDKPQDGGMVIVTDEALVPTQIVNLDEVIDRMADEAEDKDDATALEFLRGLPPETLSAFITKNLNLVAFGQGTFLIPGERNEYRQPGGSFGANGPIMMEASFLLESVDADTDMAVVVWTSELPPEEARKALPGLIEDMLGLAGADAETTGKVENLLVGGRFVVRNECRYQIAITTGLAERTECTGVKEVSIAGETRRTETRLTATQRLMD